MQSRLPTLSCMDIDRFKEAIWAWLTSRLTLGTQSRYAVARDVFGEWCHNQGFEAADVPASDLDVACAHCILDEL